MLIKADQFSARTKTEVAAIVRIAELPQCIRIVEGVLVQDLAKSGSYIDRFNDGKYSVTFGDQMWYFDGGISSVHIVVKWEVSIECESGQLIAEPSFSSTVTGPDVSNLKKALGLVPQTIGSVGRHEPLFPPGSESILQEVGGKNVFAVVNEVERLRALLKLLL